MLSGMAPSRQSDLEQAIDAFLRGFCAEKSRTHPYEWERIEGVWVMRDAPRKNARDYRKEEWIVHDVAPANVDRIARWHTRGRFFVCAMHDADESDEPLRSAYKQLGYRLMTTEPLFRHRLARIPRVAAPVTVQRVRTAALAEQFGKATRMWPIPGEHLGADAPFRQYVAIDGDEIVGWVRSVDAGAATWVSNMYVRPTHRRRGIGASLLGKMLRDDRTRGAEQSVLLSSHAGALLYPRVGYERIGGLLMFAPRKR
jgi:GNAT superfamily N-acetyltransferase